MVQLTLPETLLVTLSSLSLSFPYRVIECTHKKLPTFYFHCCILLVRQVRGLITHSGMNIILRHEVWELGVRDLKWEFFKDSLESLIATVFKRIDLKFQCSQNIIVHILVYKQYLLYEIKYNDISFPIHLTSSNAAHVPSLLSFKTVLFL